MPPPVHTASRFAVKTGRPKPLRARQAPYSLLPQTTLRDRPGVSLFVAFGLALLFTMGALIAFLIEMLLASRGLRDQANDANEVGEMHELAAEDVDKPTRGESDTISTRR